MQGNGDSACCEETIAELFRQKRFESPAETALFHQQDGRWESVVWAEYGTRVDELAQSLIGAGACAGDRVALIGRNTLEWFVTDLAIMTCGLVTVPIYPTSSHDQILYMMRHSEARWLFVENAEFIPNLGDLLGKAQHLQKVVLLRGKADVGDDRIWDYETFTDAARRAALTQLASIRQQITPESTATLIYTSGTTGHPKAVVLTHRNAVAAARNVEIAMAPDWGDSERVSCSYLPLAHVAERVISLLSPMLDGRSVYICSQLDNILGIVKEVRPTIWLAVPRVWEKMYEGTIAQIKQLSGLKRTLVSWALGASLRFNRSLQAGDRTSTVERLQNAIAKRLVTTRLLAALGLDRVGIAVTGGAPSRQDVGDFFAALGLWLQEVYGQTEGYGTTSLATRSDYRAGSCGRPFPLVDVKIAEDGEILLRGPNVSPGYLHDEELNSETFRDGWLYSGDLGRLDDDGFLWVLGRKKDIIITSGGKNITPLKIEYALVESDLVTAAVVVGDGRKFLTAILFVDRAKLADCLLDSPDAVQSGDEVRLQLAAKSLLDEHLNAINAGLSRPEKIKKYIVSFDEFTLESGLLTATLKLKRHVVVERFSRQIDEMYDGEF